jgi:maleylacetate reductase
MIRFNGLAVPAGIVSGLGCRAAVGGEFDRLELKSILVLSSPSLRRHTRFIDELAGQLGARVAGIYDGVVAHNPDTALRQAIEFAQPLKIDGVLSVGGGAVHDAAKALALMIPSRRDIATFAGRFEPPATFHPTLVDFEPLPVLTMPSTFSAAEVMAGGGFTDTATREKPIVAHAKLTPRCVFLDGEIVASTPREILAASGMNAVHHCLEALYSLGHQPITDALALAALVELFETLPALAPRQPLPPPDIFQRTIVASAMSGLTYGNSGLGIGHAICHSLGGRYGLSHGESNAVICRHSLRFNVDYAADQLSRAARAVGAPNMVDALDRLVEWLGTPRSLREIGLPEGQFVRIADDLMHDPGTYSNPRPVTPEAVIRLLEEAW